MSYRKKWTRLGFALWSFQVILATLKHLERWICCSIIGVLTGCLMVPIEKDCGCRRKSFWAYWCSGIKCWDMSIFWLPIDVIGHMGTHTPSKSRWNILYRPRCGFTSRYDNLNNMHVCFIAVSNQMKAQNPQGGSLIAISSISGLLGGAQQWYVCTKNFREHGPFWQISCSHYGPTKAAVTSLMQNCAVALGKYNIRANAVLPGTIATDINKEDLKDLEKREYMVNRTLLGRLGGIYY